MILYLANVQRTLKHLLFEHLFLKTDLPLQKAGLDLSFLKYCFENGLTSKFLHFKVSNRGLNLLDAYKQCQICLLKEEISSK